MLVNRKQVMHLDKLKLQLDVVFGSGEESKYDHHTPFTKIWDRLQADSNVEFDPLLDAHNLKLIEKKQVMLQRVAILFRIAKQLDALKTKIAGLEQYVKTYSNVEETTKVFLQIKDRIRVDDLDKETKKIIDEIDALEKRVEENELDADIHQEKLTELCKRLDSLKPAELKLSSPEAQYVGKEAVNKEFEALQQKLNLLKPKYQLIENMSDALNKEAAQLQASAHKKDGIKKNIEDEEQWCSVVDDLFTELANVKVDGENLQNTKRQFDTLFTEFHALNLSVGGKRPEEKDSIQCMINCLPDIATRGQELLSASLAAPKVVPEFGDLGMQVGVYIPQEIKNSQQKLHEIKQTIQKQREQQAPQQEQQAQQELKPKFPPFLPLISGGIFGNIANTVGAIALFTFLATNPAGWTAAALAVATVAVVTVSAALAFGFCLLTRNGFRRAERRSRLQEHNKELYVQAELETRNDEIRNDPELSTMTRELRMFALSQGIFVKRQNGNQPKADAQSDLVPCVVKRKISGKYVNTSLMFQKSRGKFLFTDKLGVPKEEARVDSDATFEQQCQQYETQLRAGA